MSILRKIYDKGNALLRRSYWINNIAFPDCRKFWTHNVYDLQLVNLGSSSAVAGFDYSGSGIKAANWAMAPQTFVGDYAILTNYCSYLKQGATILIPLCPFSSLGGGNDDLADKYYTVVRPISIPNASLIRRDKVCDIKNHPLKYYPIYALGKELLSLLKLNSNLKCKDYCADANRRIQSWMKEFSLYNLNYPFALINNDRFSDSIESLQKLLLFCKNHGFNVYIILPPMSEALNALIDENVKKRFVYDFLENANIIEAPVLDYFNHRVFADNKYFADSYFLNNEGARVFTEMVLKDIEGAKRK